MTLEQAQALAARIQRETRGVSTVVQADITPADLYSGSFHITVKKPGVLQMCIYSPAQWDDRKHLINKWASHSEEEKERQGMLFEKKSYGLGNANKAISYEVSDDNGHTAQLTELDAYRLLEKLLVALHIDAPEVVQYVRDYEGAEQEANDIKNEPDVIKGCYPSEAAWNTHRIFPGGHDDDTNVFYFFMDTGATRTVQGDTIRYTFPDGLVLVQHDGVMDTEQEMQEVKDNKA